MYYHTFSYTIFFPLFFNNLNVHTCTGYNYFLRGKCDVIVSLLVLFSVSLLNYKNHFIWFTRRTTNKVVPFYLLHPASIFPLSFVYISTFFIRMGSLQKQWMNVHKYIRLSYWICFQFYMLHHHYTLCYTQITAQTFMRKGKHCLWSFQTGIFF